MDISQVVPLLGLPLGELLLRLLLIAGGALLVYAGVKRAMEPLIMIPFGLGVSVANAAYMALRVGGVVLTNPHVSWSQTGYEWIQYFWLQPIYNFTFVTGLIACLVFMGIGAMTDISFFIAHPYLSFALASFAELGTVLTLPIAMCLGFTPRQAASIALIGGADGPIVLFSSLKLAPELFVPITVVGYLYLSLLYIYHEKLAQLVIPRGPASRKMSLPTPEVTREEKIMFSVVASILFSAVFPSASPLVASFFLGVLVRESMVDRYVKMLDEVVLSASTFFLAFVLGTLTTSDIIMDPAVGKILLLGIVALLLSSLGGMLGGLLVYALTRGRVNPLLGVAAVSCVPTTAKIAQKIALKYNPENYMIDELMGPNVAGVITTAVVASIYLAIFS